MDENPYKSPVENDASPGCARITGGLFCLLFAVSSIGGSVANGYYYDGIVVAAGQLTIQLSILALGLWLLFSRKKTRSATDDIPQPPRNPSDSPGQNTN